MPQPGGERFGGQTERRLATVDFSLGDIRRPIVCPMKPHAPLYAVNGEPLPTIHGGPLRLVIPGWPGSLSHKWLMRITIRDREHDGQGMTGTSYRVPNTPMVPGGKADEKDFRILESMPVRSIITAPANGTRLPAGTREMALST
jgi:sulfite oxidase